VELTGTATEFAEQSGKSLISIVEIAGHAVEEVRVISETTTEQAQAGSVMVGAIRKVSDMALETTRNMADSVKIVTELLNLSENLKHHVESMGSDRRRAERFIPDSPCMVAVTGLGGRPVSCRIMDIATLGLRLETREIPSTAVSRAPVRVTASDPPLNAVLDNAAGHLIWQDGPFLGIEFDKPVSGSARELESLLLSDKISWS
jgi:hypothetical protein